MWKLITLCAVGGSTYLFVKPRIKEVLKMDKTVTLRKPDYKENMIYLVQFPVSPSIRSISPFALKLETYMRMKNIPYEPVYSQKFSVKGQTPYIELNGEQIPDSNLIIQELEKRGIAKPDENLNSSQKAVNHLATVAVENHTCIASLHWRYGFNMPEFYDKLLEPYFMKVWSLQVFRYLVPKGMLLRTKLHGLGRHSLDEVAEFSYQDLDALSILLGDKLFFNGENPSTVDCTIFGHLVQFLYLPLDIPQKAYINKNCPNLASFVDRMRETFWPDWQELCEGKCMDGKMSVEFK